MQSIHILLPVLALIFAVAGMVKPNYYICLGVGLLLLAINALVK